MSQKKRRNCQRRVRPTLLPSLNTFSELNIATLHVTNHALYENSSKEGAKDQRKGRGEGT